MFAFFTKYWGDQIRRKEMGWSCYTYGGEEKCIQGFGGGKLRGRDHLKDTGIDGRKIIKWILSEAGGRGA
jgi:hypothetical protein